MRGAPIAGLGGPQGPRLAFVFPGQGAQKVGMGQAWAAASPAARQTFD